MSDIQFAQIEPTTRCNYICGFCAGRHMPQGDLDWTDFTAFLSAHPHLRHVELQGEGEPLLHPRFFDMVAACRDRDITVSVITNGSLLNEESVERLLDGGVHSIHVSMESADPGRFQRIRGGRFAKVAAGLRLLAERRREKGLARPTIGLTVTVLRDTLDDIEGIWRLYRDAGLDGGIVAQPLQGMPAYQRYYDDRMAGQALGPAEATRFRALRQAVARAAPVPSADGFFYFALFAGFDPARTTCPWLDRGAYLSQDGSVTGCCFMKDADDRLGHISRDDPTRFDEARQSMIAVLDAGDIPRGCGGCSTGQAIAATRRLAFSSASSAPLPPR